MKTIYTLLILLFAIGVNAQTAPDFTVTDTHGNEISLYEDLLDNGKTVVLDLFFVDCPPCNDLAPLMEPVYQAWGAGTADVEFISLTSRATDDDAKVIGFEEQHGTTWPAVSGEGGGPAAQDPYTTGDFGEFLGYPTLIVISPDRTVQFDAWGNGPSDAVVILDEWITNTGAEKPLVAVTDLDNVESFSIAPNPVSDIATLTFELNKVSQAQVQIFNTLGQAVMNLLSGSLSAGLQTIELNGADLPSGTYFVRVAMNDQVTMEQFTKI